MPRPLAPLSYSMWQTGEEDVSTKDLGPALPLPRSGDILVRADLPDWINNACLNYLQQGEQSPFVQGYRRGAQQLVQHVVETQSDQDFLVYPIIFLYRHHMELGLKRIIGRAAHLIERSLTAIEKKHLNAHRLDALWKDLKPMLGEICQAAGWSRLDHCDIGDRQLYSPTCGTRSSLLQLPICRL